MDSSVTKFRNDILSTRRTRRDMLRHALLVGMSLPVVSTLLAACAVDDDDDSDAPVADPDVEDEDEDEDQDSQDDARSGGRVVVAVTANPSSMDLLYRTNWINYHTSHHMYDPLIRLDEGEEPHPALVSDWEIGDDGLYYRLTIRDDVVFHDGEPFDIEALKYAFDRQLSDPEGQSYSRLIDTVESVEIADEQSLEIRLQQLRVTFLIDSIAAWQSFPVSPSAFEELGEQFALSPVGTGPFRFQEFEPDSHVEYARNEDYWDGVPLLESVRIRIIPEPSVHVVELESQNVDISYGVPIDDIAYVEDLGVVMDRQITPNAQFVSLNVSNGLTAELAVRKAIARSIDRDTVIREVLLDQVEKSRAGVPQVSPFYHDDVPMVEYDPEEAASILDEAGWVLGSDGIRERNGEPLRIHLLSTDHEDPTDYGNWGQMNEIFQEQMRQVGIDSQIDTLEWGAYLDEWRTGNFEMTYHSQGGTFFTLHQGGAVRPDDYWSINQLGHSTDPELMSVAEDLRAIFSRMDQTLDPVERSNIWRDGQMIFYDHQLTVWLWHSISSIAVQPWVQDYRYLRTVFLGDAWVDQ